LTRNPEPTQDRGSSAWRGAFFSWRRVDRSMLRPTMRTVTSNPRPLQTLTRRDVLRGAAVAAGGLALPACHGVPAPASAATAARPRTPGLPGGLEVRGTRFYQGEQPFFVRGFNYWSALPNSRDGNK